mgnify:CR=1 FL=1
MGTRAGFHANQAGWELSDIRQQLGPVQSFANHDRVQYYVDFFLVASRARFNIWLGRLARYEGMIHNVLRKYGIAEDLVYLALIESGYSNTAVSRARAIGMWQFIRSTGRQYMTISSYVDERLDPLTATESAARLLKQNYQALESWPLAVTAFNHGRAGMARAKRRYGNDLGEVIEHYTSRTFGFASKNFYTEFLAAVEVARNYTHYFGPLDISEPLQLDSVVLDRPYHLDHITDVPELSEKVLREYNPQVRQPIWQGSQVLPKGLTLRLPQGTGEAVRAALKSAPTAATHILVANNGSLAYRVRYGETLSDIAEGLGTSIASLQRANNIPNANRIYPGQLLLVEGSPTGAFTSARPDRYRVKWGDTLEEIAGRFGISMRQLQQANQINNPHRIFLGQVLLIP